MELSDPRQSLSLPRRAKPDSHNQSPPRRATQPSSQKKERNFPTRNKRQSLSPPGKARQPQPKPLSQVLKRQKKKRAPLQVFTPTQKKMTLRTDYTYFWGRLDEKLQLVNQPLERLGNASGDEHWYEEAHWEIIWELGDYTMEEDLTHIFLEMIRRKVDSQDWIKNTFRELKRIEI